MTLRLFCLDLDAPFPRAVTLELRCDGDHGLFGPPIAQFTGRSIPAGPHAQGIAITPDGAVAYVTHFTDGDTVTPIALAHSSARPPITVGVDPPSIAITTDGKSAYVVNQGDNTVTHLRL